MKKLRFFSMVCVFALAMGSFVSCHNGENGNNNNNGGSGGGSTVAGYVDLGLPSGTKWNSANETGGDAGFFTYDEAMSAFGDKLPTNEQFDELRVYCTWEWQNNGGYKVIGKNGNSIFLPASGYRSCDGDVNSVDSYGYYWSSTPISSDIACDLCFDSDGVYMDCSSRCGGRSVCLVQD